MSCRLLSVLLFSSLYVSGQARLVINGGVISIANGAILTIENSSSAAVLQTGSGYISSEGDSNRVIWLAGSGDSQPFYLPFGNSSTLLPLRLSVSGGSSGGKLIFATYPTHDWKNSDWLPPGVTNVNSHATDNSAKVIDRFWLIQPQGYVTQPSLTNLSFGYSVNDLKAPNTIAEENLVAQRWNSTLLQWDDYIPASAANTVSKTVNVTTVPGSQLYNWWTLVDFNDLLPVTLAYFRATAADRQVICGWETVTEINSRYFEVWRSSDGINFIPVGKVAAAGNSSTRLEYTFTDANPLQGISYYRLKTVDIDNGFRWSSVVSVNLQNLGGVFIYPNPAGDEIHLFSNETLVAAAALGNLYDGKGSLLQSFRISSVKQRIDVSRLAAGIYFIRLNSSGKPITLSFIKK